MLSGIRGILEGRSQSFRFQYTCNDAATPHSFKLVANALSSGRQSGALLLHYDVTEKKRIEAAYRQCEERLRHVLDQMDASVAAALTNAAKAVQLLGARAILTGVRPEVAMILVELDIAWDKIVMRSTLQAGIACATSVECRNTGPMRPASQAAGIPLRLNGDT